MTETWAEGVILHSGITRFQNAILEVHTGTPKKKMTCIWKQAENVFHKHLVIRMAVTVSQSPSLGTYYKIERYTLHFPTLARDIQALIKKELAGHEVLRFEETYARIKPTTKEARDTFLETLLKDGGESTAAKLTPSSQAWWKSVVGRIAQKYEEIVLQSQAVDDTLRFLTSLGIGDAATIAHAMLPDFGTLEQLQQSLRKDPFLLYDYTKQCDVIDQVAKKYGMAFEARVQRWLENVVYQETVEAGHTLTPITCVTQAMLKTLHTSTLLEEEERDAMVLLVKDTATWNTRFPRVTQMMDKTREMVGLRSILQKEQFIVEWVTSRLEEAEVCMLPNEMDLGDMEGMQLHPAQVGAVQMVFRHNPSLLTGAAGSGKSTVLKQVIRVARTLEWKTMLLAPTGMAARRMRDCTGHPAFTIHKAVYQTRQALEPKTSAIPADITLEESSEQQPMAIGTADAAPPTELPLEESACLHLADLVIVDESSMVGVSIMEQLLRLLRTDCRLLMVGDDNQLEPVEYGNVFRDLIRSQCLATSKLTKVYRQGEGSSIRLLANGVLRGKVPHGLLLRASQEEDSEVLVREVDPCNMVEAVQTTLKQLPREVRKEVQLLTPARRGPYGTQKLNPLLRGIFNPNPPPLPHPSLPFHLGDKVVFLKNETIGEVSVCNGDVGHIRHIRYDLSTRKFTYEVILDASGTLVLAKYPAHTKEMELAFVLTVHRCQGSEYPRTLLLLSTQHHASLQTRSMLYTAVTRAQKHLTMVGQMVVWKRSVEHAMEAHRQTALCLFLEEE